jgi:hypothetical protein
MQVKELKLFWVWNSLMEYIQSRGAGGRYKPPLAVVIDELSYFVRGQQLNTEVITEEFREFVQVRRRNANVLVTCATQERSELPREMQSVSLQLPSHLYGATANPETALENANRWFRKEPKRMRARGRLYLLQVHEWTVPRTSRVEHSHWLTSLEQIVDETPPAYMTYDEQEYEDSRRFLELPKGEWLFGKSPAEGVPPTELEHITTAKLDAGQWIREDVVAEIRRRLMQQQGIPVSSLLSELASQSQAQQDEPEPQQPYEPSLPPEPETPEDDEEGMGRRRTI